MTDLTTPSGYLREDYRLFHLKDSRAQTFDYHYHDFDKVIFFLSGQVTYLVEGRAYFLEPGDALLVPHHQIHYPVIQPEQPYERWVLWLSTDFLAQTGLDACFRSASEGGFCLLRTGQAARGEWLQLMQRLESCRSDPGFGADLLERTYCLQLLIALNRCALEDHAAPSAENCRSDPKVEELLRYINANLSTDLSVKALSARFYLSTSYLMHRFKEVTGCTVHQYVLQKRLIAAAGLIQSGVPVVQAASESGFRDYSAFLRAFQKAYHISPRELRQPGRASLHRPLELE